MKIKRILLPAVLVSAAVQLNAKTLYTECFDRYPDYPRNLNQNVHIGEMPASEKILCIRPADKQYATAFKTPLAVPVKERRANAELSFRICAAGDSPDSVYDAHLLFARNDAEQPQDRKKAIVHLSTDNGTSLSGDLWKNGNPDELRLSPNLTQFTPFSNGQWYDVKIRITDNHICVYTNRDRERLETRAEIPEGFVLAGVNFGGASAFSVDDIKVESAEGMSAPVTTEYGACVNLQAGKLNWNAMDGEFRFSVSDIGYPAKIRFVFSGGGEQNVVCNMESFTQKASRPAVKTVQEKAGEKTVNVRKVTEESVLLEDCGLTFTCGSVRENFFTVPKLEGRFDESRKRGIVRAALDGNLMNAGRKTWHFRLVCRGEKVQLWADGNYLMDIPLKGGLRTFTAEAPYGSRFETAFEKAESDISRNISKIIPVEMFPEQIFPEGSEKFIRNVFSGKQDFDKYGFDTGTCRQYLGSFELECDGYLSRSAFEAIPNSMIRRVPNAQYIRAYAVCSLGKNDPERSADVTARLTRFITNDAGRTPAAMAMQTVSLPRSEKEPLPSNVKSLGNGKYMVAFDLPIEKIQDLVFMEKSGYLDFEVLGGLYEKNNYYCSNEGKPSVRPSNAAVHCAFLEQ